MTKAEKLADELRACGLKRMAQAADDEVYSDDRDKLLIDLKYALGLKSLTMMEVRKIAAVHTRALAGEFTDH